MALQASSFFIAFEEHSTSTATSFPDLQLLHFPLSFFSAKLFGSLTKLTIPKSSGF